MIVTERLVLRPWERGDLDALCAVFAEEAVWRYPFGRGFEERETAAFLDQQLAKQAAGEPAVFAAIRRDTGALAGYIGLAEPGWFPELLPSVEVGWRLHPDHWGLGLATEGGRAAVAYGFERLGLDEILSIYEPANERSGAVMARLGFELDRDTSHPTLGVPLRIMRLRARAWRST